MQEVGQVAGQEVGSEARARHVPTHDNLLLNLEINILIVQIPPIIAQFQVINLNIIIEILS
jgi:hypothetical protein